MAIPKRLLVGAGSLAAVALIVGVAMLGSPPTRGITGAAGTAPITSVGFDIGWDMAAAPPFSDLTQADLFALQTTNGSGLDTSFLVSVNVQAWVAIAHAHHVQALITIGGSSDQNWQTACNDINRSAFVANLVQYMQSNGFDGIDLDIEDNVWAAQTPPSAAMTTCIQAISTAAKAVKTAAGLTPFVSADVITNWEGGWFAPSNAFIDQYNLMTYGDTCTPACTQFASDVTATENQGLPAAKFVLGIDVIDSYPTAGDCGKIAAYAQAQNFAGVMTWDMNTDASHGYACFTQFAPYVGSVAPLATPTPVPTQLPTPTTAPGTPVPTVTSTPTPPPAKPVIIIKGIPCTVTINGAQRTGTCTGAFQ